MNTNDSHLEDLWKLLPRERFLSQAAARGLDWYESRPGQHYGRCSNFEHRDANGSAAMRENPDGSIDVWCNTGGKEDCSDTKIMAGLGMPLAMKFVHRSRRRGDDPAALKLRATTQRRIDRLADHPGMMRGLLDSEKLSARAITSYPIGLYEEPGFITAAWSHPNLSYRGTLIYAPKFVRPFVGGLAKRMEKGGKLGLLLPTGGITPGGRVLITEGVAATLAAATLGEQAIGMATASQRPPATWAAWTVANCEVIIVPDFNRQGRSAAEDHWKPWALAGGALSVSVVDLFPELHDGTDLADVLREEGPGKASSLLASAIDSADVAVRTVNRGGRPPKALTAAVEYLKAALGAGQIVRSRELAEKRPSGISERTYARARRDLNVQRIKLGNEWWMFLDGET